MNFSIANYTNKTSLQWVPLILAATIIYGFWSWYFTAVDGSWLSQTMFNAKTAVTDITPEERSMLKAMLTPSFLKASTLFGALGGLVLTAILMSTYVTLFSRFAMPTDKEVSFTQSFNITSLASLGAALLHGMYALYVLLSPEHKVSLYQVDFLTLNNLFFNLSPTHSLFGLANGISLSSLLFVGLCGYLLHKRTGYQVSKAIAVYGVPYIILGSVALLMAVV
ncbi:hypothetical protein D210916BOD24_34560 [Alteromonas sp. D210916BOD_24]|uniref:hypothetical protein n=1 Tax=Alteromonas sp. D210916BOD_24 TaxID=3157618 RepID=UPI00399CA62E